MRRWLGQEKKIMSAAQEPIGTPFGPFTTAEEVARDVNVSGKTAIVTGRASNLGHETVGVLNAHGARVVLPARDRTEGVAGISRVEIIAIDLLDPASVLSFADGFLAEHKSLDLLILSAGVMATPLFRDAEGHEGQFATNHLGHFRLTTALWPALRRRAHRLMASIFHNRSFRPLFTEADIAF
jgi:NAD(P)-dependent dehydrogenase (short-subunit alcohol dehydrogenase family)